jgi:hypothetical protein
MIKTKTSNGESQRQTAVKMTGKNNGQKDKTRNQGGTGLRWVSGATAMAVDRGSEESKLLPNIGIERNRAH